MHQPRLLAQMTSTKNCEFGFALDLGRHLSMLLEEARVERALLPAAFDFDLDSSPERHPAARLYRFAPLPGAPL
jgi:hypothetical protein